MACQYDGGVVLGADSRTSTGNYVANRASDKITMVTDNVWMCRSGSVRVLGKRRRTNRTKRPPRVRRPRFFLSEASRDPRAGH
jgi:20S proteasome alpha/beta subunit